MNSALYYPYSSIRNEAVLKEALLLWDHIDVITPDDEFKLVGDTRDATQALELVAKARTPSTEEKQAAHERIVALANQPLPDWFAFNLSNPDLRYLIWFIRNERTFSGSSGMSVLFPSDSTTVGYVEDFLRHDSGVRWFLVLSSYQSVL